MTEREENQSTVGSLLVVDDEPGIAETLCRLLDAAGFETQYVNSAEKALAHLANVGPPDVLLVDLHLSGLDGLELLERTKSLAPDLPVVIMTARGNIEVAVRAMKHGAFDFLTKPFEPTDIVTATCLRAVTHVRLARQNRELRRELDASCEGILAGSTRAMKDLRQMIAAVAPTDATALVVGETGTGKELVSRAIHDQSARRGGRFVPINCGALSEHLLESELFGHVKGAFTGAATARRGLFETASGGTLFLDEVGELSLPMQTRLLRVLQEGEVRPVGSDTSRVVDVRIVAATHRDLERAVAEGTFREDLYFRINVFRLRVPALRERIADLPSLVHYFLEKLSRRLNRPAPSVDPDVMDLFAKQPWRGNLRQLENTLERAFILARDRITLHEVDVPPETPTREPDELQPFRAAKTAFEREYMKELLNRVGGRRSEAARVAGLDPSNLRRILKRHGLE
ncbi:MAG: sigma-54-dependent Fis family transcriptional regulator [Myxococcales bacterium]|nr:sigma-54-dependent Fis family transcriptional regulator [Myxococcales bacterium]